MRIRFNLRTLLILTAVIATFLGVQLHVTSKANSFVEMMQTSRAAAQAQLMNDIGDTESFKYMWGPGDDGPGYASLTPLSITDVILLRRRCEVYFATNRSMKGGYLTMEYKHTYRFTGFGHSHKSRVVNVSCSLVR